MMAMRKGMLTRVHIIVAACLFGCAVPSARADAVTNTWNGGSGNFDSTEMWSLGTLPGPTETVVIPNAAGSEVTDTITVNSALDIGSLVVGGGSGSGAVKLVFKNGLTTNVVAGSVTVKSGATLTHTANSTAKTYVLNLKSGGDMTIESGAAVDADCCGFKSGGPGATGQGGSYGGYGGGNAATPYGSIREPVDLGSNGKADASLSTWAGGGAIMLDAVGTMTVKGTVRSRGGLQSATGGGCGGSGGSILIKAAILSGTGTIFKKHAGQTHGDLIVAAHLSSSHDIRRTPVVLALRDADLTFDTLTVSNWARFEIGSGATLMVVSSINSRDAYLYAADSCSS